MADDMTMQAVWSQLTGGAVLPPKPTDEPVKVDHAAEARKIIAEYDAPESEPWELHDEIESRDMRDAFKLAQVHATLALVGQQRIANLIAYSRSCDDDVLTLDAAIREGLGL